MTARLYSDLKTLIYDENHRERQCRAFLKYTPNLLFKEGGTAIRCDVEYRGHSGDSDYIVSGQGHESGIDCIRVYIWELKAPQCFVFKSDPSSHNRLIPSMDLIQAENQLLNYYDELRGSSDFRDAFNISHFSNVRIGGIIIGCDRTKVEGEKVALYDKAFRCRELLYTCQSLRLMLWNTVLEHLKPVDHEVTGKTFEG